MIAVVCDWGGDITVGPSGDIGVAQLPASMEQRVVRRLLTNPGEYIWHTNYGAGLGSYVGTPYAPGPIEGAILDQLAKEELIAATPRPEIRIDQASAQSRSATSVIIKYQMIGVPIGSMVVLGLGI